MNWPMDNDGLDAYFRAVIRLVAKELGIGGYELLERGDIARIGATHPEVQTKLEAFLDAYDAWHKFDSSTTPELDDAAREGKNAALRERHNDLREALITSLER